MHLFISCHHRLTSLLPAYLYQRQFHMFQVLPQASLSLGIFFDIVPSQHMSGLDVFFLCFSSIVFILLSEYRLYCNYWLIRLHIYLWSRSIFINCESVQFSRSVVSHSVWPHGLQHARLPCPSPASRSCSNSYPSSQGCHPTISSSVIPLSSCLQSFPASGSFLMSQFFASGGQGTRASASASVLPMNIQDWSPLGWTGWISLQSKGLSRVFSKPQFKSINSSVLSFLYSPTLTSIHDYWKNHSFN